MVNMKYINILIIMGNKFFNFIEFNYLIEAYGSGFCTKRLT